MSDRLVGLSTNAWFREGVKQLRASHSYTSTPGKGIRTRNEQPLRDQDIAICVGSGSVDKAIADTITEAVPPHISSGSPHHLAPGLMRARPMGDPPGPLLTTKMAATCLPML